MTRMFFMFGLALAAASIVSGARAADKIGVAACDEFLTKYEACLSAKVPAAQQATFKAQVDAMRNGWVEAAKNASTKASLEPACKQVGEQMKTALQAYGCAF